MQTPPKNTSSIIKQTLDAKRKSRHRLIGSIFLLFIALIVLLNITAKVKPSSTPIKVDIKNTSAESNPITFANNNSLDNIGITESGMQIKSINITATPQQANNITHNTSITATESNNRNIITSDTTNVQESIIDAQPKYQAQVINRDGKKETTTEKSTINDTTKNNTPKPISYKAENNTPDPLDILNDTVAKKPTKSTSISITKNGKFYIQLASVSHKENVLKLQNELNNKGVQTFIQEISTPKGTMYRLRVGPFGDKNTAEQKLTELKNQGQSAIITSN